MFRNRTDRRRGTDACYTRWRRLHTAMASLHVRHLGLVS